MKWFKHYENASTNRTLDAMLCRRNGHEMLGMYWLLMEALCDEFKKDCTEFSFSSGRMCAALRVKYDRKAERFLQDLQEIVSSLGEDWFKFDTNSTESLQKIYTIYTPIILDLIGKEFKRTRQQGGRNAAKNKNKNKKEEVEVVAAANAPKKLSITHQDIIDAWEKLGNRTKGFFLTPSQMRKLVELNNYFTKEKFDLAIERLRLDDFYLKAANKSVDMILSEEILGRVFQKENIADLREAMIED